MLSLSSYSVFVHWTWLIWRLVWLPHFCHPAMWHLTVPPSSLSFQITELWHIWPISIGIKLSVIPQEGSSDLQQDPLPSLLQGGRDVPLLLPSFTQQSQQAWERQPAWNHIASIDLITPLLCGNLATAFCFQARSWGDKSCYYLTHLPHATWPILLCLHPLLQSLVFLLSLRHTRQTSITEPPQCCPETLFPEWWTSSLTPPALSHVSPSQCSESFL